MLRPSYTDLLEVFNRETDDITLGSRYTIVIAAAKRARQLVDHAEPLVEGMKVDKPVSVAVNELYQGKIKVREGRPAESLPEEEPAEDLPEEPGSADGAEGWAEEDGEEELPEGEGQE